MGMQRMAAAVETAPMMIEAMAKTQLPRVLRIVIRIEA